MINIFDIRYIFYHGPRLDPVGDTAYLTTKGSNTSPLHPNVANRNENTEQFETLLSMSYFIKEKEVVLKPVSYHLYNNHE